MENFWQFIKQSSMSNLTFDDNLEQFYKLGIDGLIRENIQNSMDAKLKTHTGPVKISIKTGNIDKNDIPGIENIFEHIKSLNGQNQYSKETIENMHKAMYKTNIPYISFEDFYTEGLNGIPSKNNLITDGTWMAYAYHKGYHYVNDNDELENIRGGSHGIGKIASNSASDIHTFFFANCDDSGNQHLGGGINLIDHIYNNQPYSGVGYFTDIIELQNKDQYFPFKNNFHDVFKKDTRGLKIIIPYLREEYNNVDNIIKSICNNFFVAILDNKLIVEVNNNLINADTISSYINNSILFNPESTKSEEYFTPIYLDTYCNHFLSSEFLIEDKNKKLYPFKLYFQYDENIKEGRTAIIRQIGMKIEDRKVRSNIRRPYNAILIPENEDGDIFLKSLENASHTKLETTHFRNKSIENNAKRFLNNMDELLHSIIRAQTQEKNLKEEVLNTEDIIYSIENSFKKEMEKQSQSIRLNSGNKDTPKTIEKIKTTKKKDKKKDKPKPKETIKNKIIKTLRKRDNKKDMTTRNRYSLESNVINRLTLASKEILNIDLSNISGYLNQDYCDLSLFQIDGEGIANKLHFNIYDYIYSIKDLNSNEILSIENNIIKDVRIINGLLKVELSLKDNYSNSFKFLYSVEV